MSRERLPSDRRLRSSSARSTWLAVSLSEDELDFRLKSFRVKSQLDPGDGDLDGRFGCC
jgi:hypothetical protein